MVDIPKSWVLLDTCSTVSVTNNTNLVTNIRDCEHHEYLKAVTNGGSQLYKQLADMILFPIVVHFKKDSMANILSFKDVFAIPGVRITMDTAKEDAIVVTTEEGKVIRFKPYSNGLFYFDTKTHNNNNKSKESVTQYTIVQTVDSNKQFFTSNEIEGADVSRKYQEILYFPGTSTLKTYLRNNLINNSAVTVDDVNRAEIIYGPSIPNVQGQMTRYRPITHEKVTRVPLPPIIQQQHQEIALSMDFFFVNGNIFFHTKSHKLDFISVQSCTSRTIGTIIAGINVVKKKYDARNFSISDYHADNEFDKAEIKDFLTPANMNIYARLEHVGDIERSTRTIKERCRATCHSIPYKRFTKLMVRSLIEGIVHIINSFPSKTGISNTMSPAMIVEGRPKLDFSKRKVAFGTYVLVYAGTYNDMKGRATPAIALRMSNNDGGYYFMSLHTGKRIHGYHWKELPVDEYVIERVESLAKNEDQPIMHNGYPHFEWAPNLPISDDLNEDFDSDYPIVNVLNETNIFKEMSEGNNNVNESIVEEIDEYETNDEESVDRTIDGNIISDDERHIEENEEVEEELPSNDNEEEKSNNEEESIVY